MNQTVKDVIHMLAKQHFEQLEKGLSFWRKKLEVIQDETERIREENRLERMEREEKKHHPSVWDKIMGTKWKVGDCDHCKKTALLHDFICVRCVYDIFYTHTGKCSLCGYVFGSSELCSHAGTPEHYAKWLMSYKK